MYLIERRSNVLTVNWHSYTDIIIQLFTYIYGKYDPSPTLSVNFQPLVHKVRFFRSYHIIINACVFTLSMHLVCSYKKNYLKQSHYFGGLWIINAD